MDTVCVICTVKVHIKTCDIWAKVNAHLIMIGNLRK